MWMYVGLIVGGYVLIGVAKLMLSWARAYWLWKNENKGLLYTDSVEEHEGLGIIRSHAHATPFQTIISAMRKDFFTLYARSMPNEQAYKRAARVPSWFIVFVYVAISILVWPNVGIKIRQYMN